MKCKICNREFESNRGLYQHLRLFHNLNIKEYYDIYFKQNDDGLCIICGKKTKFKSGDFCYYSYCSSKCANRDEKTKNKIKQTKLEKYGVENNTQLDYYKKLNRNKYKNKTEEEKTKIKEKTKETCLERYNIDNPAKLEETKQKIKNTCLEKYNTEYALQSQIVIEKRKQTNIIKYGVENVFQNKEIKEKIRNILIERGYNVDKKEYKYFENFYKKCISLTKINIRKNKFKENWNGYDYYDNEYIKDNYNLYETNNENYPNIDHKISIIYGFLNNISIEKISSIDNLCFTKRKHNSSKFTKNESDFKYHK